VHNFVAARPVCNFQPIAQFPQTRAFSIDLIPSSASRNPASFSRSAPERRFFVYGCKKKKSGALHFVEEAYSLQSPLPSSVHAISREASGRSNATNAELIEALPLASFSTALPTPIVFCVQASTCSIPGQRQEFSLLGLLSLPAALRMVLTCCLRPFAFGRTVAGTGGGGGGGGNKVDETRRLRL